MESSRPDNDLVEELREERNFANSILDTVGSLVVVVDRSGRILRFNRACEEASGYSFAEVCGRFYWDLFLPPEDIDADQRFFRAATPEQFAAGYENTWLARDGTRRRIEWAVRFLGDGDQVRYVIAAGTDITERRKARDAVRESEERFRTIFDEGPLGMCLVDSSFRFARVNRRLCAMVGYTEGELTGLPVRDITHPDDIDAELLLVEQLLAGTMSSYEIEKRYLKQDGGVLWIHLTASVMWASDGQPYGLGTIQDITTRKHAADALRESEANFRGIIEHVQDVFYRLDAAGRIQMVSPSVSQFGYTCDELIGTDVGKLYSGREQFVEVIMQTGAVTDFEVTVMRKDGTPVAVSSSAHLLFDRDDQIVGMEGMVRDIGERKRAEEAARLHQVELAHTLRLSTMGEMAAGLAHELSQPIAAIANYASGCVRRIKQDSADPTRLLDAIQHIADEAHRAGEIIQWLRGFVRKGAPHRTAVDVNQLVREVARFVEDEARKQDIAVHLDLAPALPLLDVDGIQIEQVLLNLVRNGLEAMEGESCGARTLTVYTGGTEGGLIETSVCDSGSGFSPALESKLFDPFFTTKDRGLGMGLAISRSIVDLHGGRLWGRMNPDGGATFGFTLPGSNAGKGRTG